MGAIQHKSGPGRWGQMIGPATTLLVAAATELLSRTPFDVPNPPALLLLSLVFAAFTGGLGGGLISAAIAWLYTAYFFSLPGQPFQYTDENLRRVVVWAITMPATALIVGLLNRRAERAAEAASTNAVLQARLAEREQVEAALQASERQLSLIYANISDVIFYLAVEQEDRFRFVSINSAFLKATGLTEDQIVGKLVQEVIPEPAHALVLGNYKEAIRTKKTVGWEEVSVYPAGKKYGEVSVTPIFDANGNCTHILGTVHDITELKRTEEAARQAEQRLSQVFEASPVAISITTLADGRYLDVNEAFLRLTGYQREEVIGKTSLAIGIWDKPADRSRLVQALQAIGSVRDFEFPFRTKSGELRDALIAAELIYLDDQPCNLALIHDITERKRAEEAVRASTAMFQGLFEYAPDAVVAVNREGRIVQVNAQAEAKFGYHRDELLGQTIELLLPERFAQRHAEHRAGYVAEPHPRAMGTGLELYGRRKDGSEFAVDITLGPLNTDDGLVVMSIIRDITERKRTEEALARYTQDLARSNAELEQFAYVASHDLQEPLRAVAGTVQLLKQRYHGQLDARADEFISHAVDGATRMQALIGDLLAYSRVGTGGKPFEPTDCAAMLKNVLTNLAVAIRESSAVVTHDALPTVMADPTQMSQLLQNLIGNALKFRGERPPEIQVSAERREGAWQFSVRDNGIGLEPQYLERIFRVFQRLHTRREYPGTGIGLAICKRIVERHGGSIWAESAPGRGSTFYFTLPGRR